MDNYDSKTQFFQVVFVLKTFINGYKGIALTLDLSDQLRVRKRPPFGLGDTYDLVVGKGLLETRIDALV